MAQLAGIDADDGAEQLAAGADQYHAIDIDAAEPLACAVCTEPLEWVAFGPCGHREVCSKCTVRIRICRSDHRCCICRELCPVVIVTKAGDERRDCIKLALLATFKWWLGSYWYHTGSAAYFDDERQ